jgi:hypothetical protein
VESTRCYAQKLKSEIEVLIKDTIKRHTEEIKNAPSKNKNIEKDMNIATEKMHKVKIPRKLARAC